MWWISSEVSSGRSGWDGAPSASAAASAAAILLPLLGEEGGGALLEATVDDFLV